MRLAIEYPSSHWHLAPANYTWDNTLFASPGQSRPVPASFTSEHGYRVGHIIANGTQLETMTIFPVQRHYYCIPNAQIITT
jgi:hypothetical protein